MKLKKIGMVISRFILALYFGLYLTSILQAMQCEKLDHFINQRVDNLVNLYDNKYPGQNTLLFLNSEARKLSRWTNHTGGPVINPNSVKQLLEGVINKHKKLDKVYYQYTSIKRVEDKDIINALRRINESYITGVIDDLMRQNYIGGKLSILSAVRSEVRMLESLLINFDRRFSASLQSKEKLKRDIHAAFTTYTRNMTSLILTMSSTEMKNTIKNIVRTFKKFNCEIKLQTIDNAKQIERIFNNSELFKWIYYVYVYSKLADIRFPRELQGSYSTTKFLAQIFYTAYKIRDAGSNEYDLSDVDKVAIATAKKQCDLNRLQAMTNTKQFGDADRLFWIGMHSRLTELESKLP